MRHIIAAAVLAVGFAAPASALTFKTGEVLGPDGNVYTGASPEQLERLIERAAEQDMPAGVVGNNVFVVVEDQSARPSVMRGPRDGRLAKRR